MIYGVIPCRYASTRFPGKALAEINGKPMFWWVYDAARRSGVFDEICVSTDSHRIAERCIAYRVPVVVSNEPFCCGTDRVCGTIPWHVEPDDIVINIQGDEPLLDPGIFRDLVDFFDYGFSEVVTPVYRGEQDYTVRVIADGSRAVSFTRDHAEGEVFNHIGVYAFLMETLREFYEHGQGVLEQKESLEQMRLIEMGVPIHVVEVEHGGCSVDVPEDISKVEMLMGRIVSNITKMVETESRRVFDDEEVKRLLEIENEPEICPACEDVKAYGIVATDKWGFCLACGQKVSSPGADVYGNIAKLTNKLAALERRVAALEENA